MAIVYRPVRPGVPKVVRVTSTSVRGPFSPSAAAGMLQVGSAAWQTIATPSRLSRAASTHGASLRLNSGNAEGRPGR